MGDDAGEPRGEDDAKGEDIMGTESYVLYVLSVCGVDGSGDDGKTGNDMVAGGQEQGRVWSLLAPNAGDVFGRVWPRSSGAAGRLRPAMCKPSTEPNAGTVLVCN